jgi:hypothetical protein
LQKKSVGLNDHESPTQPNFRHGKRGGKGAASTLGFKGGVTGITSRDMTGKGAANNSAELKRAACGASSRLARKLKLWALRSPAA